MDTDRDRDADAEMQPQSIPTSSSSSSAKDPSASLRALASTLYTIRRSSSPTSTPTSQSSSNDIPSLLSSSSSHFATTRSLLRTTALSNRSDRQAVNEVRSRMDGEFLKLQNRRYEVDHLCREIERCGDYE